MPRRARMRIFLCLCRGESTVTRPPAQRPDHPPDRFPSARRSSGPSWGASTRPRRPLRRPEGRGQGQRGVGGVPDWAASIPPGGKGFVRSDLPAGAHRRSYLSSGPFREAGGRRQKGIEWDPSPRARTGTALVDRALPSRVRRDAETNMAHQQMRTTSAASSPMGAGVEEDRSLSRRLRGVLGRRQAGGAHNR
jgi:hypothetical protein